MNHKPLAAVCFGVVCITLSLGLWPFHAPRNQVDWLRQANGLEFGKYGTALSSSYRDAGRPGKDSAGAIELWAQPDRQMSATLLALYRPDRDILVTLRQSLTDLELVSETKEDSNGRARAHFYVDDAFSASLHLKRPVFITITAGPRGIAVYLDGVLTKRVSNFSIPEQAFGGQVIVGDSARQPHSFRGQIRGLAIYDMELSADQALKHYQNWARNGGPSVNPDPQCRALYLFNEGTGNVAHNLVRRGGDLRIPEQYMVVDKIAMEPFWTEFDFSRSYWSGNVKNIIGFIPLGFCFYAYFASAFAGTRSVALTLCWGLFVSITIEVLQIWLPTRDSGTTDLITNTLGTYLGILCYRHVYPPVLKRFPQFGWLLPGPNARAKG